MLLYLFPCNKHITNPEKISLDENLFIIMNNTEDVYVTMIHPEMVIFGIYSIEEIPDGIEVKDLAGSTVQLEMKAFKEKWSMSNGLSGNFTIM